MVSGPVVVALAKHYDHELAQRLKEHVRGGHDSAVVNDCDELLGYIENELTIQALEGLTGPQLSASRMHPWVWGNAASLWDGGHHRQAVQTAASAIFDVQLPAKLGMPQGTKPEQLVGQAFDEQGPRLKLDGIAPGNDWANAYQGAMHLGFSCAKLVRNLGTHHVTAPADEDILLEELAMLSRFARLVDSATLDAVASSPKQRS